MAKNQVEQHVKFFADEKGNVTSQSIENGHKKLQIDLPIGKTATIMKLITQCPSAYYKDVAQLKNPAATPLWVNGFFQESEFKKLELMSLVDSNGQKIITREILNEFQKKHVDPYQAAHIAAFVTICPVTWSRITKGSLLELENWLDCEFINEKNQPEPVWKLSTLHTFFSDNMQSFANRIAFIEA